MFHLYLGIIVGVLVSPLLLVAAVYLWLLTDAALYACGLCVALVCVNWFDNEPNNDPLWHWIMAFCEAFKWRLDNSEVEIEYTFHNGCQWRPYFHFSKPK